MEEWPACSTEGNWQSDLLECFERGQTSNATATGPAREVVTAASEESRAAVPEWILRFAIEDDRSPAVRSSFHHSRHQSDSNCAWPSGRMLEPHIFERVLCACMGLEIII